MKLWAPLGRCPGWGLGSGSAPATPTSDTEWAHLVLSSGEQRSLQAGRLPSPILCSFLGACKAGVALPAVDPGQQAVQVCQKLAEGWRATSRSLCFDFLM